MQEDRSIVPSVEDEQNEAISDTVSGGISLKTRIKTLWRRLAPQLPVAAIYARYALPLVSALTLLVMGLFHNVLTVSSKVYYNVSLWKLYVSTITGTHKYLGGELKEAKTWFYGLLSAGAIVCTLVYLVVLFLSVLALYTAIRAFRAGHESEEASRYKVIFKVAFPNRIWLFASNLLLLIPAAFPHFMQLVGSRFLAIGTGDVMFVLLNRPLLVSGIMLALTLVLALVIPRFERRRKMNMFLVWHAPDPSDTEEEEGEA